MTIQRMDNVAIVVDDLDATVAFFTELGMELEGKAQIEGVFADRTVGSAGGPLMKRAASWSLSAAAARRSTQHSS